MNYVGKNMARLGICHLTYGSDEYLLWEILAFY